MSSSVPPAISGVSLGSACLLALADLATLPERTALTGTSYWTDALFVAPGIHTQQNASNVNGGELPASGAMTTGYVFRIENQAMVFYMLRVARPGQLVEIGVERVQQTTRLPYVPRLLYAAGIGLTILCYYGLSGLHDHWAVGVLSMLVFARALNVAVIRRRAVKGWKGVAEPGVQGDLIVLLSQDRWVRIRGTVDDIKEVTSGQWLRDLVTIEGFVVAFSKLLVYAAAALAVNASSLGNFYIALLLLVSAALLGLCNALTTDLHMFGCRAFVKTPPKAYARRLDMVQEMIEQHDGRREWAVGMGLVRPEPGEKGVEVIM